jgi:hypothetical protein
VAQISGAVKPPVPARPAKEVAPPKTDRTGRLWLQGCGVVLALSLLGWMRFGAAREQFEDYLLTVWFHDYDVMLMSSFCVHQVGWFVLFLALSMGLMAAIFSGAFGGVRANLPWVVIWDYQDKYASNPVVDRLRDEPHEHRVTSLPGQWLQSTDYLKRLFRYQWLPQVFPYYNIQTLDIVDMPRMPEDLSAYLNTLKVLSYAGSCSPYFRFWQLTGTDYILGTAAAADELNQDPLVAGRPFTIVERFDAVPKPGYTLNDTPDHLTVQPDEHGPYALLIPGKSSGWAGGLPKFERSWRRL